MEFQKIRSESDFTYVLSLLPNLMVGLRHIWTMSNYYCYDAKMENLIQKISFVFTEKIKEIIQLNHIFSRTATEAYELATNCAKLLVTWRKTYMATRAYIENSGVGSRWEFNKVFLFSDVEHCARISSDIAGIAKVLQNFIFYFVLNIFASSFLKKIFMEYENIFGYRLKNLVSDPEDIDNMLKKVD